jgi:hypothetical protein
LREWKEEEEGVALALPLHPQMAEQVKQDTAEPSQIPLSTSQLRLGPLAFSLVFIASVTFASLLWLSSPSPVPYASPNYSAPSSMPTTAPRTLRLGTFNIRMDGSSAHLLLYPFKEAADKLAAVVSKRGEQDSREKWGEKRWYLRREKLVDQVVFSELDVVGFQEVLDNQYEDLKVLLGKEWEHVGVGQ